MTSWKSTNEQLPKAVWEGTFKVYGIELKCYVLDNGQRIIDAECMGKLLEAMENPSCEPGDMEAFIKWQKGGIGA